MRQNKRLRIAAVQCDIRWEDISHNIEEAKRVINNTDADLIVLPEMFATGFSMDSSKISQSMESELVSEMRSISKSSGKALIFSAAILEDDRCYNRLFFMTPDSEEYHYDKRHLFRMAGEHQNYSAGSERIIIEYRGFRICPLVCYDLRFPVFSRGADAYDVLIYIASWPEARSYAWSTLLRARAIENQCYCVGVNRVGSDPKNVYSGDSVILDYMGEEIISTQSGKEQAIVAELSLDNLEKYKSSFAAYLDADSFKLTTV